MSKILKGLKKEDFIELVDEVLEEVVKQEQENPRTGEGERKMRNLVGKFRSKVRKIPIIGPIIGLLGTIIGIGISMDPKLQLISLIGSVIVTAYNRMFGHDWINKIDLKKEG